MRTTRRLGLHSILSAAESAKFDSDVAGSEILDAIVDLAQCQGLD